MRFHLLVPGGRWATVTTEAGFVGKALEFTFPEADAGAVAAAAIGRYGQGSSLGIACPAEPLPPAANALDRKFGGIGIDPDIDPSLVGGNVIDAVRRHLTQALDLEVMDAHRLGISLAPQLAAAVLEVADQFLLLGVDGNRRITGGDRRLTGGVDVLELGISVGVVGSLAGLAISLTAILLLAQQPAHQLLAHLEALPAQRLGNVPLTAADPT